MKLLIPLFFFVVLFTACNESATNETAADEPKRDTVDYRAVIDETNKLFTASALKGDSAALFQLSIILMQTSSLLMNRRWMLRRWPR